MVLNLTVDLTCGMIFVYYLTFGTAATLAVR
jgi:hypothetical protein